VAQPLAPELLAPLLLAPELLAPLLLAPEQLLLLLTSSSLLLSSRRFLLPAWAVESVVNAGMV